MAQRVLADAELDAIGATRLRAEPKRSTEPGPRSGRESSRQLASPAASSRSSDFCCTCAQRSASGSAAFARVITGQRRASRALIAK